MARLTRSATLLAKLSVFFLPISFITSYFSIQIPDLINNYTGADYWHSFAVAVALSFVCVFVLSKMLIAISDHLDRATERLGRWLWENMGRWLWAKMGWRTRE